MHPKHNKKCSEGALSTASTDHATPMKKIPTADFGQI